MQVPKDPANGYAYVEIGGIKWATMNVGATSETDYGLYFRWGETQDYTTTTAYKFNPSGDDYDSHFTKYFTKYNSTDGKTVLDIEDDAARANWGGDWRMPTKEEFATLKNACNYEWVTDYKGSGVNGELFTDKTDTSKTLFFPAAGYRFYSTIQNTGQRCQYLSSARTENGVSMCVYLSATIDDMYFPNNDSRANGYSVRGVLAE